MKCKTLFRLSLSVLLALAALAWLGAPQPALAGVITPANYTFTAEPSPSLYHTQAKFTLSATGDGVDPYGNHFPPIGYVTFYDGVPGQGGQAIYGCESIVLNMDWMGVPTYVPAVCQVTNLAPGAHTITADFDSIFADTFPDATLTLQHTVNVIPLTITPDALPDAMYGGFYSQPLTASGSSNTLYWSEKGKMPNYVYLGTNSGKLEGTPTEVGTFHFTVTAEDRAGALGTKDYTLIVTKGTPLMTLQTLDSAVGAMMDLESRVYIEGNQVPQPTGAVSFYIDDVAVAACSGANAVRLNPWGDAGCYTALPAGISAGTHTVRAEYVPDATSDYGYATTTKTASLRVYFAITGVVFNDLDMDGVKDAGEPTKTGWTVSLDQDCNGTADKTTASDSTTGQFSFWVDGDTYCLKANTPGVWRQSTPAGPFTLDGSRVYDLGIAYHDLKAAPTDLEGDKGVPFGGVITASGGRAPYGFAVDPNYGAGLPPGLTPIVDGNAGTLTLSGTPTQAGGRFNQVTITDADQVSKTIIVYIMIRGDGSFELTSSANPSEPGQAVTFTLTGTGDAYYPGPGYIMPAGTVTFKDGDSDIAGCINLKLNINPQGSWGWVPAVCITSALANGVHSIQAVYDASNSYHDATLTLTQRVAIPDTTSPAIIPHVTGTLGQNDWYTGDVSLTWTVVDAESDIISQTGCDAVTITGDQAATKYICSATSAGGTGSVDVTIQRDATRPVTQVTGVTEGSKYTLGSVPQAGCSTEDNLSGVATEATVALTGGDPQGLGNITATCSGAADKAGNAALDAVVHYTVVPAISADLRLTKVDSKDPVRAGAILRYTLTLTNLGPNATQSVKLVDTLDPNTTFLSFSAPQGAKCSYRAGVVTCTGTNLPGGKGASIIITVLVKGRTPAGTILVNRAEVTSATYDLDLTNNSVSQETKVR